MIHEAKVTSLSVFIIIIICCCLFVLRKKNDARFVMVSTDCLCLQAHDLHHIWPGGSQ